MELPEYKDHKELILAPAIKPGSYMDHLSKHPEEVDASLRRMGIDPDELERLLLDGDTILVDLNNFKDAKITKIKKEA